MFLLPECHGLFSSDETVWLCTRSLSVGTACLFSLVISIYACRRVLPIFLSTAWYSTNLSMLLLTALQMALLVYECFIQSSAKILVVTKYCRALQVAISCMLYGKVACDTMGRNNLYYQVLAPVVVVTMLLMTVDAIHVVVVQDDIDCRNLSWLVSSIAAVILSASFAIPGRVVLDELKSAYRIQRKFLAVESSATSELEQSHVQLWTLVVCNVVCSSFQLSVDLYVTNFVTGSKSCNSMFFEDGSGALEQLCCRASSFPRHSTCRILTTRIRMRCCLEIPAMA